MFHRTVAFTGADLPTIGKALAPATQLKWLVLRTAGVEGDLACDIILPSLQLLSLTRNGLTVSARMQSAQPSARDTQQLMCGPMLSANKYHVRFFSITDHEPCLTLNLKLSKTKSALLKQMACAVSCLYHFCRDPSLPASPSPRTCCTCTSQTTRCQDPFLTSQLTAPCSSCSQGTSTGMDGQAWEVVCQHHWQMHATCSMCS
jgi:hypothetical protein